MLNRSLIPYAIRTLNETLFYAEPEFDLEFEPNAAYPDQHGPRYTVSPYLRDYLPRHDSWHPPVAHKIQHQKKPVSLSEGGSLSPVHLSTSPVALPVTAVRPYLTLITITAPT